MVQGGVLQGRLDQCWVLGLPDRSNTRPGPDMADASGNNANYYTGDTVPHRFRQVLTTVVGEFQNSDSPYGTFDQGGNVWEWNEAILYQYRGVGCVAGRSTPARPPASLRPHHVRPPDERGTAT